MRRASLAAFALALLGLAGNAGAVTSVAADITVDTTWTKANDPYILQGVIFVRNNATLTIEKGVIVRGQPRTAAPTPGSIVGTPGSLVVTNNGKINAVGTPAEPIIFTTAAIDNNNDNVPDTCGGPLCTWTNGDTFYDDDPVNAPIAPLNANGAANVSLWGGLAILGNAPTNLGNGFGLGQGKGQVEGLVIPGFPVSLATYGGVDPHDDSGRMVYVSIRNAGDEIQLSNELNCLTLAGVGDVTELSHIECQTNFDDGFEWFGGTVNGDHLAAIWIGDDSFDMDQGYTGINQFLFAMQNTFQGDGGGQYGAENGDAMGEWDGEDSAETGGVNLRPEDPPVPAKLRPWPFSHPLVYNFTGIGSTVGAGVTNPGFATADNRGIRMRNGFAGELWNAIIVNTGTRACLTVENSGAAGFTAEQNAAAGEVVVGTTTCDDGAAIAGAGAIAALTNGDGERCTRGALPCANPPTPAQFLSENIINDVSWTSGIAAAFAPLAQEITAVQPKGTAANKIGIGMLSASAGGAKIDPRPVGVLGVAGAIVPEGPGVDSGATFRGAFEPGVTPWTGFTSLSKAGLLVP